MDTKHLQSLGLSTLTVFAPIKAQLITVLTLIAVDLISGILAARKRKEPINSKGLRKTLAKFLIYEIAIILAFLVDQYLVPGLNLARIASTFVGITELKSCYENLNELSNDNLLKSILEKLADTATQKDKK